MQTRVAPKIFCVLLGSAASLTASVSAQQIPETNAQRETIEILARKNGYADVSGLSFSTVPLVEELQTSIASDLLKLTPGLSVGRQGPVGALTQVRIRGSEANQTLVFVDGVEANDPAAGEFDFSGLSAVGLSRIEILRGPQSALWGTEAIGGVVNVISDIKNGARLSADAGTQSSYSGTGAYGIVGSKGEIGAQIGYQRTSGVSVARNGTEKDGFRSFNALLKGRVRASDTLTLSGSARYQANRSAFDDFVGGTVTPLVDANQVTKANRLYVRGAADLFLYETSHQLSVRFVDTRNRNLTENAIASTSYGSRIIAGYQGSAQFEAGSLRSTATIAAEYRRETFRNVVPNAFPGFDPNQKQSRRQLSLIGDYLGEVQETSLAASLRHDDNRGFGNATTWRLTARQKFSDADVAVRGSYGTAITNPTFFEQFGYAPDSFISNPAVRPERGKGWDAGLDYRAGNREGFTAKLTYFNTRLTDEIVTVFTPSFLSTVLNAATRSKRQGIEIETAVNISAVKLFASYTGTKSTEAQSATSAVQVKEVRRPAHQASLAASWRAPDEKLSLTGALAYTGKNRDVAFDANFDRVPVTLNAYVEASATANYKITEAANIFARIENAFDARREDVFGYAQPGISVAAGLRLDFGK